MGGEKRRGVEQKEERRDDGGAGTAAYDGKGSILEKRKCNS